MALDDRLRDDARALYPELVALRRRLHQHPEIGLELPRTQGDVLAEIDELGLEVSTGTAVSSVTAVLRGGQRPTDRPAPVVLLRGDMDALPVTEDTGLDYASTVSGAMHACGHDLHTTMLVGAARLLSAHRDALPGDVVFMFQPGEEGWDGARYMVEEGVLDAAGRRADCAYGLHVVADRLPRGTFATRPGPLLAASAALRVTVHGAGGHGSTPHLSRDPITAAATMVTGLQTLVTRRFDVFDPVVLTVGTFAAGTKRNIIPDEARFEATVRTFSAEALDRIAEEAPRLCRRIASGYGCEAEVELVGEYPLTRNDPAQAEFALQVLREVFGEQRTQSLRNPHTAAEDFSRVLDEVPGCYMFLGAHPGDDWHGPTNHSPRAEFDDEVLAEGTLLHAQLAVWALRRDLASVGAPEGAS